jgi:pyruvate,water dikinase
MMTMQPVSAKTHEEGGDRSEWLLWLEQVTAADGERVGGKAGRLASMLQAGFDVPQAFCIVTGAYWQQLSMAVPQLEALLAQKAFAPIQAALQQTALPEPLLRDVYAAYHRLTAGADTPETLVAVRSSATAEDMDQYSFAGLYETVLKVRDERELADAIRTCWASYWSEVAAGYREQAGLDHCAFGMGVVVQVMVEPVLAGVLFTRLSLGSGDAAMVEIVEGIGERLVNGDVQGQRLLLDRDTGKVLQRRARRSEIDLSRLLELGLAIEQQERAAQDIEWVVDGVGQIWILQTRPITSQVVLGHLPQSDVPGGWLITYDEPFAPLGSDIAMKRYTYWVRAINRTFKTAFRPEMRNIDGLLYYNPTWRGGSRPLRLWMGLWRLLLWLRAGHVRQQYSEVILRDYVQRLQALNDVELAEVEGNRLLAGFQEAIDLYLQFQFTSYAVGAAATLAASVLEQACRRLFKPARRGGRPAPNALDLLAGISDVSLRREQAVDRLAVLLRETAVKEEMAVEEALEMAWNDPLSDAGAELQRFLASYGYIWADRYPRDPAWELNREAMLSSLMHAVHNVDDAALAAHRQQRATRRQAAVAQALAELDEGGRLPWRSLLFRRLLQQAELLFPYKEERNHQTYAAVMVIRRYAHELGQRLYARQIVDTPEDIFFLTEEEIVQLWRSRRAVPMLQQLAKERKQVYLLSRRAVQQRQPRFEWAISGKREEKRREVRGEPCSPGLVRGPARLISGPGELQRVQPGDIMVCTQLRPAWASVFARAGGVVIEMGSLLSHGSTLAREYGIPAVINVPNITTMVREDDWLVVDGHLGKVVIERGVNDGS